MRCKILSCLAALLCAVQALAQTAPATSPQTQAAQPDLLSPLAALQAVYVALRAGDMNTARACLYFKDAKQAELFDVTYSQLYAPLQLMHAMEVKFGPAGRQPFANAPLELSLAATLEKIKITQIEVNGDSATVVDKKAAINPSSESELTGIMFKKQGEQWKVVAATFSDVGDIADMPAEQLRFMRMMRDAVVLACQATETRLEKGEFKTADEAYADYQSQVQLGVQAALAAGESPATRK